MEDLIAALQTRGQMGFCVFYQGEGKYVACGLSTRGVICNARTWAKADSPEEAVNKLARQVLPAVLPRDCDGGMASDPPSGVNLAAAAREPGRDAEGS